MREQSETWTLPSYARTDMVNRRSDLQAAIEREEKRGRDTGLLHAARRAVAAMDKWLG
jgi:hypothetical protein